MPKCSLKDDFIRRHVNTPSATSQNNPTVFWKIVHAHQHIVETTNPVRRNSRLEE
jgi:hypothetical protein